MIKKLKYFLTLFVIGLGVINFSSAVWSVSGQIHNIGIAGNLNNDLTTDLLVKTKGNFLTDKGNVNKKVLDFGSNHFMWWGSEGNLYIYETQARQGYANWYRVCPVINENTTLDQLFITDNYCENGTFSQSYLNDFLNNVKSSDYYALGILNNGSSTPIFNLCISSSSDNSSLCFGNYIRRKGFYGTSQGFTVYDGEKNSYTFETLDNSILYNSPAGLDGSDEGGEGSNNDILIISSCSKQKALNYYENKGYTDKLCYGGYDDFTIWNGSPTGVLPYYGSGLDIEEIWLETANYYQGGLTGNSQSYKAWFGYRRQMYSTYKRGGYSSNPFVNTPLVMFGLFGAVDTYGSSYNSNEILEYCDLKLYTADYTVDYTGINYNNVCTSPISFLDDQINDIISGSGYNGTGSIGINTNEVLSGAGISLSGDLLTGSNTGYVEGSNFILDFSQKLKNNFGDIANNNYGQGILPIYITLALLGLILFRFMSH